MVAKHCCWLHALVVKGTVPIVTQSLCVIGINVSENITLSKLRSFVIGGMFIFTSPVALNYVNLCSRFRKKPNWHNAWQTFWGHALLSIGVPS